MSGNTSVLLAVTSIHFNDSVLEALIGLFIILSRKWHLMDMVVDGS